MDVCSRKNRVITTADNKTASERVEKRFRKYERLHSVHDSRKGSISPRSHNFTARFPRWSPPR